MDSIIPPGTVQRPARTRATASRSPDMKNL